MKKVSSYLVYPLMLSTAMMMTYFLREHVDDRYAIFTVTILSGVVIFILERLLPETNIWKPGRNEINMDVFHALFSNTLPPIVFTALFQTGIISLGVWLSSYSPFSFWPASAPLLLQVAYGFVVAEIGFYTLHRFMHNSKAWRLHALHHSIENMYLIAGSRTHPVQVFFTHGIQMALLWLVGAPIEVFTFHAVFTSVNGLLQHANIKMRCGFLNYVFATPELHRWHHSRLVRESNNNYGSNLIIWDVLFRTRYLPKTHRYFYDDMGLPKSVQLEHNLIDHLELPFRWDKHQADTSEKVNSL